MRAGLAGPAGGVASMATGLPAHLGIDIGRNIPVWPGVPVGPRIPSRPETPSKVSTKGYHTSQAQPDRLGPVLRDQDGRRVDRPLKVSKPILERVKKGSLCYYLFLRGSCISPTCGRSHAYRLLTDEELDALWQLARQGRCYKSQKADRYAGDDCSDALCVYGHRSGDK